jgi:hypothetical protein
MNRPFSLLACASALSLGLGLGCDGLGRPVVDHGHALQGTATECTRHAPHCDDVLGAPEELEEAGAASDLPACELEEASAARIVTVLRDCTLSLSATLDEEREIAASVLDNVRIEFDGQVKLRISDSQLFRVTVEGHAAEDETPALLQVIRTDLRRTELSADQIETVSCYVDRSLIESSQLSGVDLETTESILLSKTTVLSAARIHTTQVAQCETLLIAGSSITNSRFPACDDLTRLYDVQATGCSFDGQLETDASTFADGRFGVSELTQLHGWGTSIENTILCAHFDNARFSGGGLTCVACQGPLAKSDADVCVDTIPPNSEANFCQVLENPPVCDTFPRRSRPIVGP